MLGSYNRPSGPGYGAAPRASKHCSFSLPEVIQRVGGQTPGITDAGEIDGLDRE